MGTARCSRAQKSRLSAGPTEGQAKRSQTRMPGGVGGAGSIPVPTRFAFDCVDDAKQSPGLVGVLGE